MAESLEIGEPAPDATPDAAEILAIRKIAHRTTKNVAEEIEGLRFNRAVAQIYELTNALPRTVTKVSS